MNNLKDEIRQVCGKYGVKVQDATEKGMASLRKQEREEKSARVSIPLRVLTLKECIHLYCIAMP